MQSKPILPVLAALFIAGYFFAFSYDGLRSYFTFDDGMNMVFLHRILEVSIWTNILNVLKVFTKAYRPLGGLFYRAAYYCFGFHPLPFRVAAYLVLLINIALAYRMARALGATREASALSTLLFCYNAAMLDLYYSTGTIYDLLCFSLYIGALLVYIRGRSENRQLSGRTMVLVAVLYAAALDAKEMAVTFPVSLLLYEGLYHYPDFRSRSWIVRTGTFLAAVGLMTGIFLKVKVADLSGNQFYHITPSLSFILSGMGGYLQKLLYLPPDSLSAWTIAGIFACLLLASAALRNRAAIYGTLFFAIGLFPVAIIPPRGAYAAYVAYPGLTLALGAILASARSLLLRRIANERLQTASSVALFLLIAVVSIKAFAYPRRVLMGNALWDQIPRRDIMEQFKREIPELPPSGRILILDDPWGPEWGIMFLARLLYHDPNLWVDHLKNTDNPEDRDNYDLLVTYKPPLLRFGWATLPRMRMKWEIRPSIRQEGALIISGPTEKRAIRNVDFSPSAARPGDSVTVTVPGLSDIEIDAIYRLSSNGKSATHIVENWCTLDSKGVCTVTAPRLRPGGTLSLDWIRPAKGKWIFTKANLKVQP